MQKNKHNFLMETLGIPIFENLDEFCKVIGLSSKLIYLLSTNTENYYSTLCIPKKNGKQRKLYIPSYTLKIVQKWILKNILNKLQPSEIAMAFRKNTSKGHYGIKQNASFHASSLYGLSIDLCDFFPSVKANKVYHVFKNIGYNNFAAALLTNLCTLEGELPQGAVCSPALSNLICKNLDSRLIGLCAKRNINYSRYADDIYFSCDNKIILLKIYPVIEQIINSEGFTINKDKLHYHTPRNKKHITGITIVSKGEIFQLKAPKELKRKIRAEIFKCIMTGSYENIEHIKGEISYVSYIQKDNTKDYIESIKNYINKISKKIIFLPELVNEYNNHPFFKDAEILKPKSIKNFKLNDDSSNTDKTDEFFIDTIMSMYEDRKSYLLKHKYTDICKYEDWPIELFQQLLH